MLLKRLSILAAAVMVVCVLAYALAVANNNLGNSSYTRADLQQALDGSMRWLETHSQIQHDYNSMLWWMLIQASRINSDTVLGRSVNTFVQNNTARYRHSVWSYLVTGQGNPNVELYMLGDNLPDYNVHFIYAMNCSASLAGEKIVSEQNEIGFCWKHHPVSPACTTHQLMSFRFMQRTACGDQALVADSIRALSDHIQQLSTWDFRVVDVYIQRVLMQYDSGNAGKVNKRWIRRILDAQHADGGWGDLQPLVPLGGNRYLGFNGRGIGIGKNDTTFHATAQGIWLLAMLLQQAGA